MFQMISTGDNKRPAAAFLPRDFHADPGMAFSHILANCAFVTSPGTGGARSLLGGGRGAGAGHNTQFADYRAAGRFSAPRGETLLSVGQN
jgi:hypothetical protein